MLVRGDPPAAGQQEGEAGGRQATVVTVNAPGRALWSCWVSAAAAGLDALLDAQRRAPFPR